MDNSVSTNLSYTPNFNGSNSSNPIDDKQKYIEDQLQSIALMIPTDGTKPENDRVHQILIKFKKAIDRLNLSEEKYKQLTFDLLQACSDGVIAEISKAMTEKDKENWETFIKTNPNEMEQLTILDKFLNERIGYSFADLQDKVIERTIISTVEGFNKIVALKKRLKNISDEKLEEIHALLSSGNFEDANLLIDKFSEVKGE